MASNCSLIYSSAPAFSAGALCFLGCCVECCLGRLVECRLGIRVRAAGRRHAIWGDRGRRNLVNTCQITCYKTGNSVNSLPLLDLRGTGARLWQRFERRPTLRGAAKKSKRDSDTTTLVGEMPALCARAPLTAKRPSHALAVAKQMLRSPASLEAEWVDETEPFSELVGSPLSDGGPTVVFGVRRAILD